MGDVSLACQAWSNKISSIIGNFIPKIKLKRNNSPPWIDADVIALSKRKETKRRKALSKNSPQVWASYRQLRNELRTLVKRKHNNYLADVTNNLHTNPKRFWSLTRTKSKRKSIPNEITLGEHSESNARGKAKLFNSFFASNFAPSTETPTVPTINHFIDEDLATLDISIVDVRLILSSLDTNKATGPDNISATFLKECASEIAPSLTALINLSITSGTVPDCWKLANICPVYKKDDPNVCNNYRPISLLCITSKILERAILNKIYEPISNRITDVQHGFMQGRSTTTQLLSILHKVNNSLDSSVQTDIIYLDFSKAFDTVPHDLLIHKLPSFGICGNLLRWFSSYVTNRKQRVVVEGAFSDWLPVTSGVPQGSLLGPILFLLYTNDIVDCLTPGTSIALYADDTKICRTINSPHDCLILQSDLASLQDWSHTWKLNFNAAKCKVLNLTRVLRFPFMYELNSNVLEQVRNFNDLGLIVTSSFSWKSHIANAVSKANKMLGLIKRTLGPRASTKSKITLYNSLVKPSLMYMSALWYPDKGDLQLIEGVQRRATKYILNDYASDYRSRLLQCNILPLSYQREFHDLCLIYKGLNNFLKFNMAQIIPLNNENPNIYTRNRQDTTRLPGRTFATETAANFYSNRVIKLWNNLPESIRLIRCNTKKIKPFKNRLYIHFKNLLTTKFTTDNTCTWISHCRCAACRPCR